MKQVSMITVRGLIVLSFFLGMLVSPGKEPDLAFAGDSDIQRAAEWIASYEGRGLGKSVVLESPDDIHTAGPEDEAQLSGADQVQPPKVIQHEDGQKTATLFAWAQETGILSRWDVTLRRGKVTFVHAEIVGISLGSVGGIQTEGPFLPRVGKVIIHESVVHAEEGTILQQAGPEVEVSNHWLEIFEDSTQTESTTITVSGFGSNEMVTVVVTVDGVAVNDTSGNPIVIQTDNTGSGSASFTPTQDARTGRAVVRAQSSTATAALEITDPTSWNSTSTAPCLNLDTNPGDDERGGLTLERVLEAEASAAGSAMTFQVHYTDQNLAGFPDVAPQQVLQELTDAYESQVGEWGFNRHTGGDYDADGIAHLYISDGEWMFHFDRGTNAWPDNYCVDPQGTDRRINLEADIRQVLEDGGYFFGGTDHLVAHEHFHNVQFAYGDGHIKWGQNGNWYAEGTARFIESLMDPDDTHNQDSLFYASDRNGVNWYLANTDRVLTDYSYSYALFWAYLYANNGGTPTIERIFEAFRTAGNNAVVDGPQAISGVLSAVPGAHDSFAQVLEGFALAILDKDLNWDGRAWGDLLDDVSLADSSIYTIGAVDFGGNVNEWAIDYLKVDFVNPLHQDFPFRAEFIGDGDSAFILSALHDDTVRTAILQHPVGQDWSGLFYVQIPKGLTPYTLHYVVVRTATGGTGWYDINAEIVDQEEAMIGWGLDYLRNRHANYPNGSWYNDVGITGLATLAFLNHGYKESDPDVQMAIQYLLANVRSDGSIYSNYNRRNYHTSMALLPLKATQNSDYADEVEAAKNWLLSSQWDDSCLWGSVGESSWYWGGFGYGYHSRPDLSNSQFALLALNAADVPQSDPAWGKALTFVSRCQNRQASNDGFSPHDDGGFIYYPGGCLTPGCASYGSITGAGMWGLALAGRTPDDPRFKAALDWVEDNYTWDYNPLTDGSWGSNSLYYYYLSMSKALTMARKTRIGGVLGIGGHDWYEELSEKLESLQRDDGSWANSNSWLMENVPELATSYALLALQTRQLPKDADLELVIILHSPADLHLYDEEGRHVGKNYGTGGVDLEVPGSSYSPDDPQTISIHPPVAGNYHLELVGTGEGDWQIEIIGLQDGVQVSYDSYAGSITPGAVLATDLNVGAFEGALTIFSSQPTAAPVLDVDPTSLSLTGQPGAVLDAAFTASETGGNAGIQGVGIFATDLSDGSGNSIPGANVSFDPNNFDLDPGASQSVDVSVSVPGDAPDGDYSGSITVESLNAGTKSVQLTVEVRSNTPPTADANGPYYGNEGQPVTLDASASWDPDENITLYEWDLDNDGEYDDATGVNPEVVFYQDGTYPIGLKVTDEFGESDTDATEVQVDNVAPGVSADVTSQEVQYSDYIADVTFTATDVALDLVNATTSWSVGGGGFVPGLPDLLALTDGGCTVDGEFQTCTWTLSGIMDEMAGDYTVRVTVTDEDGGQTDADIGITVLPEDATVAFADANPVSVQVAEPEGNSGPFSLAVDVSETDPDEPVGSSAPGDISLAQVSMSLVPVGPGGPVDGTCTAAAVDNGVLPVTCDFDDVPVNTYSVMATVAGGYYEGAGEDVLVVYDPSLGFATGGGWFYWPGTTEKTNFGFTMKYNKKGGNVKGNLLLIRHVGDEAIYRVKSNALYGLALGEDPSVPMGWASFSGKCTYLEPGWPEPIGNYEFVVYVEDRDEPGTGVDRAWIEVLDQDNNVVIVMSMDRPATDNAVELGGGNVAVPH